MEDSERMVEKTPDLLVFQCRQNHRNAGFVTGKTW
ncbi:hypothetical protein B23_1951 [Geobacillus thermoleovorans B23]|nr:hypothetical protein B23_1951 [Geobacillus thermoleovorans B23]